MPSSLPGIALVTGAASGIGAATATAFVTAGCSAIALIDMNEDGLQKTKEMLLKLPATSLRDESAICTYTCNVLQADQVTDTFTKVQQHLGRVDYVVNCAGVNSNWKPSVETSPETFDLINGINYRGIWLCSREEIRIMQSQSLDCEVYPSVSKNRAQRGAIVHIASSLGMQACPGSASYCGSKAAVMSIARADALDNATHAVRVNAVAPGLVDSPMTIPGRDGLIASVIPQVPMKRFGLPEEIADTAVFLCSNMASFIHGAAIPVDGGVTAGMSGM